MSLPTLGQMGEFGLIERLGARLQQREGVITSIGDDAAVLAPLGNPVVTSDALVEGVHFRRDWTSARALGRKCLAVNVSDIAAMGGTPVAAFINLTVSPADDAAWLLALYDGFEDAARQGGFTVAGGDISRTPWGDATQGGSVIGVTLVGDAPRPVRRSGARPEDVLIVTGALGEAAAGLWLLQRGETPLDPAHRDRLLLRHFEPEARVGAMRAALGVGGAVHAALDLSDGLAGDAAHMARASRLAVEIDLAALPLSAALLAAAEAAVTGVTSSAGSLSPAAQARDWALFGGEDYELLLAVAPGTADAVVASVRAAGVPAAVIGRCAAGCDGGVWLREGTKKMRPTHKAWTHF